MNINGGKICPLYYLVSIRPILLSLSFNPEVKIMITLDSSFFGKCCTSSLSFHRIYLSKSKHTRRALTFLFMGGRIGGPVVLFFVTLGLLCESPQRMESLSCLLAWQRFCVCLLLRHKVTFIQTLKACDRSLLKNHASIFRGDLSHSFGFKITLECHQTFLLQIFGKHPRNRKLSANGPMLHTSRNFGVFQN